MEVYSTPSDVTYHVSLVEPSYEDRIKMVEKVLPRLEDPMDRVQYIHAVVKMRYVPQIIAEKKPSLALGILNNPLHKIAQKLQALGNSRAPHARWTLADSLLSLGDDVLFPESSSRQDILEGFFRQSADRGFINGQLDYGAQCIVKNCTAAYKEAFHQFSAAARQGCAVAECNLGNMYIHGLGVKPDEQRAFSHFSRSASSGFSYGELAVGTCYLQGVGVPKSDTQAFKYFRPAAQQGNIDAMYYLGCMLLHGKGVPQDEEAGGLWLHISENWDDYIRSGIASKAQSIFYQE